MKPHHILWAGGVLFVAVALVVWLVPGVFPFLDEHPWIVTGLAASVTALATALIAYFTRGTWELFRHAEDRRQARTHLLKREVKGLSDQLRGIRIDLEALKGLSTTSKLDSTTEAGERMRIHDELSDNKEQLETIVRASAEQSQELLGPLVAAEEMVDWAMTMLKVSGGPRDFVAATGAVRSAEEYLHEVRGKKPPLWGNEDFEDTAREEARKRILSGQEDAGD